MQTSHSLTVTAVFLLLAACRFDDLPLAHVDGAVTVKTVVCVIDGDSVVFKDGTKGRLAFIDAPERCQPYAIESRYWLTVLVQDRDVGVVELPDKDHYGRALVVLYHENRDINWLMLRGGWAWHYAEYASRQQSREDFKQYAAAESRALIERKGLWRASHPVAPWSFRQTRKSDQCA